MKSRYSSGFTAQITRRVASKLTALASVGVARVQG
jgi:hypothetical protein